MDGDKRDKGRKRREKGKKKRERRKERKKGRRKTLPPQLGAGIRGKIEFIPICKYFLFKCPFSPDINWTELPLPAGAGKPVSIN